MKELLYGRNAARECLRARRRHIHRVMLADTIDPSILIDEIINLARQAKIPVQRIPRKKLDSLARNHQGVILEVGRYPTVDIEDILLHAEKLATPPFIIALDHIEDPHNLGAILRTAEVVGVHGVLLPKQRAVEVTPAVVSASAGAAEHMGVAKIPNLPQALKRLKQNNIWVVGVENTLVALPYHQANLAGPIALVIGSEGRGMSRLVKETCDFLIKLPMRGQIESLNASVACSLILYEVWRARGFETA
ncbi:MAG: 23S rRNA (guanosine(2251)-2'-O)-methyltransferase RlmB [Anaerolineae bacterium]|nr:23S rRNA (guanosine(2251)-2'-O)-methyltransferase RlmB [Anaerolineae bacterium]